MTRPSWEEPIPSFSSASRRRSKMKKKFCFFYSDGASAFRSVKRGALSIYQGSVVMFIIFLPLILNFDTATVGNLSRSSFCRIAAYHTMADVIAKSGRMTRLVCVAKTAHSRRRSAISQFRPPWQRIDLASARSAGSMALPDDVIAPLHLTIPLLPPSACF